MLPAHFICVFASESYCHFTRTTQVLIISMFFFLLARMRFPIKITLHVWALDDHTTVRTCRISRFDKQETGVNDSRLWKCWCHLAFRSATKMYAAANHMRTLPEAVKYCTPWSCQEQRVYMLKWRKLKPLVEVVSLSSLMKRSHRPVRRLRGALFAWCREKTPPIIECLR